ncbi:MAG: hypothetical protein HN348_22305, partial [Proteobacteria bacterium]|nr:hypothetical protein [Pseudomonadota bacterium]
IAVPGLVVNGTASYTTVCVVPQYIEGDYYLGALVDPLDTIVELNETNNVQYQDLIFEVAEPVVPDLAAGSILLRSFTYEPGDWIDAEVEITNIGTGPVGPAVVDVYLSSDNQIDASDTYICTLTSSSLAVNGADETDLPSNCVVPMVNVGSYYLGALIDPSDIYAELDESNNSLVYSVPMQVLEPQTYDLTIISADAANYFLKSLDQNEFYVRLANLGNRDINSAVEVTFFFSDDDVIDMSDTEICATTFWLVEAGGEVAVSLPCEVPILPDGEYYFGAFVDSGYAIAETDEFNNTAFDEMEVDVYPGTFDLVALSIDGSDVDGARPDDWVYFDTVLSNQGDNTLTGFSYDVYLSTNNFISTSDELICNFYVSTPILAGETRTFTEVCQLPAVNSNDYYVGVILDPANVWDESNESNNTACDGAMVDIPQPNNDLSISQVWQKYWLVTAGMSVEYTIDIWNGGSDEVDGFAMNLYYSTNNLISTADYLACNIDASSYTVPAYGTLRFYATCNVPNVPVGDYYAGVIIDPNNDIVETNESNNTGVETGPHSVLSLFIP